MRDTFDKNWNDFLTKYGLRGNKWLSAYCFGSFCRALPETIREAIRQLPSKQRAKREREFDAPYFHIVIPCATKSAIETQFQYVYTHEKFREVQAQFRGKVNYIIKSMHSTLGFTTYEVVEQVSNSKFDKFMVTYDTVSRESKNIKRRHTHIKSSQDEPLLELRSKRFNDLVFWSHNICKFASESEELTEILHGAFDKVMDEMQEYQERSKGKSSLSREEAMLSDVNDLQSAPHVKRRGRPKNRLGSNLEKNISKVTKKKKKTAPSELNLLDSRSNIQSSYNLYNPPDMNYPRQDYMSFNFY
ncbi:hypothetical protein Ahy_A05g025426 [Arachis hypogaea]|uniref:Protein FAR1-RELATED SEQUENCE n=1 Tax=Arachis hypogaea TaxID=3818 RepID=A0A445D8N4_ARAHY|nr:hypothetical protein Ahy_A05g025426 [Arachis hypogaea]